MKTILRRWFPPRPDRSAVEFKLREYYRTNAAYHAMTHGGDKTQHPQVGLLRALVRPGARYLEIGCGGGKACAAIAESARVCGTDVSRIALSNAAADRADMRAHAELICARGEALPFPDHSFDGAYSFEVLEHVWDPIQVMREAARVTKPGGFILISTPNRFSLDLHLNKNFGAVCLDILFAAARRAYDAMTGAAYRPLCPDLDHEPYPDCDMVAAVIPANFARAIQAMGCDVDFWDTTYMCAHRPEARTDLAFQRNTSRAFFRHFGDHLLLLAHKYGSTPHSATVRPNGRKDDRA